MKKKHRHPGQGAIESPPATARTRSAQGATEYLVLLAAVLLISLIASALLGWDFGVGAAIKSCQSSAYWQSARPFGVNEAAGQEDGSVRLVLQNNCECAVMLKAIVIGGVEYAITPTYLDTGQRTTITVPTELYSSSGFYEGTLGFEYDSVSGLTNLVQSGSTNLAVKVPTSLPAACVANDEDCSSSAQCCQTPNAQSCVSGECCYPQYTDNIAGPDAHCCPPSQAFASKLTGKTICCKSSTTQGKPSCSSDADCCHDATSAHKVSICQNGHCCNVIGESCVNGNHCCSGRCNQQGVCY